MATFGPLADMRHANVPSRPPNFPGARLIIQQRCLGTLAHELGNITSPVSLVADVLEAGSTSPAASHTLRLSSAALARATTVCRLLRGNLDHGALSPSTIADSRAWWDLCAPYVADMLPDGVRAEGTVCAVALTMSQYEALVWATVAIARFAAITRPTMTNLCVSGTVEGAAPSQFVLHLQADGVRSAVMPRGAQPLLKLATWEMRRSGGRMRVSDTDGALDCRITLPLSIAAAVAGGCADRTAPSNLLA